MAGEVETVINELRRLHGELDYKVDAARACPTFVRSYKCPLDAYERRGQVTPEQHSAGMAFHELYFHAFGRQGSVERNYRPRTHTTRAPQFLDPGILQYLRAYQAVRGVTERRVAVQVCCYDTKAGADMLHLRSALDDLLRHFRKRRGRDK